MEPGSLRTLPHEGPVPRELFNCTAARHSELLNQQSGVQLTNMSTQNENIIKVDLLVMVSVFNKQEQTDV